jgi:uncharacterized RDD family membrane protein YckC
VDRAADDVLEGLDETATGLDDPLFASQALDDVHLWSASGGETLSYASLELPSTSPEQLPAQSALAPQGKTFGSRAGAYIIDSLIYSAMVLGGSFVLGFLVSLAFTLAGRPLLPASTSQGFSLGMLALSLALGVLYFAVYEWLYGASPGKLILKMRVVQENGRRPSLWAALLRGVFRYVDGLLFGFPAAAVMNRDSRRQRYGDRYAHTLVVDHHDSIIQYRRSWLWFLLATLLACLLLALGITLMQMRTMRVAPPWTVVAASELNLRLEDLGQGFTLADEVGMEVFEGTLSDANVRLFVGDEVNLQAQVLTFPFYPTDTVEELLAAFQQEALLEDPTLQLSFGPIRALSVGEPAGVAHFTRPGTGDEGYLLFSIQRNVVTRLFSYGMPGAMAEAELVRLARIVDSRVR